MSSTVITAPAITSIKQLKGKKVAPAEPIRKGAERCRIRGRIGEYLVTRIFKRAKGGDVTTELRIERDNESMPPTEAFMRSLTHFMADVYYNAGRPDEFRDIPTLAKPYGKNDLARALLEVCVT